MDTMTTITRQQVNTMSWDDLAQLHGRLLEDPAALAEFEELVEERERIERAATAWLDEPAPAKRVKRENVHQRASELFEQYVATQYDRAVIATNGQMLNEAGRRAGIDSWSLFRGPVSRVKKYGSDELNSFFGQNGRHTFLSFRYSVFHWPADRKAWERAMAEDFGHVAQIDQPVV